MPKEENMYSGPIQYAIAPNVQEEMETLAKYRYKVKVLGQDPKEVYERLRQKYLETRLEEIAKNAKK
jgi:hypothetical protein